VAAYNKHVRRSINTASVRTGLPVPELWVHGRHYTLSLFTTAPGVFICYVTYDRLVYSRYVRLATGTTASAPPSVRPSVMYDIVDYECTRDLPTFTHNKQRPMADPRVVPVPRILAPCRYAILSVIAKGRYSHCVVYNGLRLRLELAIVVFMWQNFENAGSSIKSNKLDVNHRLCGRYKLLYNW